MLCGLGACSPSAEALKTQAMVDSLNALAYQNRYKDATRSWTFAEQAEAASADYPDGLAEALNHRAYVRYQQMNFDEALSLATRVGDLTNNQVELLAADVMQMKICQRISANHDFFVHRNRALRRFARIREEEHLLNAHWRRRLLYCTTEFHIVSATYFFYLQQPERARAEMELAYEPLPTPQADTAQWLYARYMTGSGGLYVSDTEVEVTLGEFDQLMSCYTVSRQGGYLYFEGNSLQAMASLLSRSEVRARIYRERPGAYTFLCNHYLRLAPEALTPADDLSQALATAALNCFVRYNDLFQTACAYRTLGELALYREEYEAALQHFAKALSYVNHHHERYYPDDSTGLLQLYAERPDSLSVEMQWTLRPDVKTVPEWIAGIREQLSVVYAALNQKPASDFNRNVYLDLLDITRQDKELLNRYEELDADTRRLSLSLWTAVVLLILCVAGGLIYARRWRKRAESHAARLRHTLDVCRCITASSVADAPKLPDSLSPAVAREVQPYLDFARRNLHYLQEMDEERELLHDERRMAEQRIAAGKRKNVENRAKMALVHGITPFLDRIIHEVNRLQKGGCTDAARRLHYIEELALRIEAHNELLTQWIRLQQGELSLHIENVPLAPLFDIIRRGHYTFEQKGIRLVVPETTAVCKADRSLTLFMLHTLADNARKFTPSGGTVTLAATEADEYVELSVADTGCGLSAQDVETILSSKVYDAGAIGRADERAAQAKGSGFGLMNCKGIIEKYRKTSDRFRVCLFGIESRVGEGSRFYFRLPRVLPLLLAWCFAACGSAPSEQLPLVDAEVPASEQISRYTEQARVFADSAYYANIEGRYPAALAFADSGLQCVNAQLAALAPSEDLHLALFADTEGRLPVDVECAARGFALDYDLLLDVRNEAAVASLALHDRSLYRYNNLVYTQLYKRLSQDATLEADCRTLEQTRTHRNVALGLILLFALFGPAAFYLFYFRPRMRYRFNLSQVLEVNHSLLALARRPSAASPEELLQCVWLGLNELHPLPALHLWLTDGEGRLQGRYSTGQGRVPREWVDEWTERALHSGRSLTLPDGQGHVFPLVVEREGEDEGTLIGALFFDTTDSPTGDTERMMDELVARYMALLLYQLVVRRRTEQESVEQAEDERRRAQYEEAKIHVQNQVLDNCLATLKHETMYYPARIRRLVEQLMALLPTDEAAPRTVADLAELVHYYKSVYSLLCAQADRQLAEPNFRRRAVPVADLMAEASRYFHTRVTKVSCTCNFSFKCMKLERVVQGDADLLHYLLRCLLDGALSAPQPADATRTLTLTAEEDGDFVRVRLTDSQPAADVENPADLFTPEARRIPYLISVQIIRLHDLFTNHSGCRLVAETDPSTGGLSVWFTVPRAKN